MLAYCILHGSLEAYKVDHVWQLQMEVTNQFSFSISDLTSAPCLFYLFCIFLPSFSHLKPLKYDGKGKEEEIRDSNRSLVSIWGILASPFSWVRLSSRRRNTQTVASQGDGATTQKKDQEAKLGNQGRERTRFDEKGDAHFTLSRCMARRMLVACWGDQARRAEKFLCSKTRPLKKKAPRILP